MARNTCAVVDCDEEGRPQVCPFDGKYHHHGSIHYTNEYGYPERLGLRFRDLSETGWLWVCNDHIVVINAAMTPGVAL